MKWAVNSLFRGCDRPCDAVRDVMRAPTQVLRRFALVFVALAVATIAPTALAALLAAWSKFVPPGWLLALTLMSVLNALMTWRRHLVIAWLFHGHELPRSGGTPPSALDHLAAAVGVLLSAIMLGWWVYGALR